MQKGALKSFDSGRGLEKISTNLFIWFSVGLTHNFHVKKGALKFLWSDRGEATKIFVIKFFLYQVPQQVFVNSP